MLVIMGRCLPAFVCIMCNLVISGWTWNVLSNMGAKRQESKPYIFKNEYIFGDCKNKKNTLYEHVHKTIDDVQKASIIRVVVLTRFEAHSAAAWLYHLLRVTNNEIVLSQVNLMPYMSPIYRIEIPQNSKINMNKNGNFEWMWYIKRLPKCIILRASSYESDTYRITRYNFEICVPRVTFCYGRRRYNYYFYEWYIPEDIVGSFEWDIYFYGPSGQDWVYAYKE